jgi:hypothetical protein
MTNPRDELDAAEQAFKAELLRAAQRLDAPSPELAVRVLERLPAARHTAPRLWMVAAAGFALAAGAAVVASSRWSAPAAPAAPSVAPEPIDSTPPNPCANAYQAAGKMPLIDDFEDADSRSVSAEGRGGPWMLHFDFDEPGTVQRFLRGEPRPESTPSNGHALHVTGPELRDWGALAHVLFGPHSCYDASAYAGITFAARGPGRIFAGIQVVDVTPRRWGGTCDKDCYNTHVARIDLTSSWQSFELAWDQFRQRGYNVVPVDPTAINSVVFQARAEDTPFDFWIDDIAFLPR